MVGRDRVGILRLPLVQTVQSYHIDRYEPLPSCKSAYSCYNFTDKYTARAGLCIHTVILFILFKLTPRKASC